MYQSIGINLSKNLDAATKRIKVPAITQRSYTRIQIIAKKISLIFINLILIIIILIMMIILDI